LLEWCLDMSEVFVHPDDGPHFKELHADNGETVLCFGDDGQCAISVEIADVYNPEERKVLTDAAHRTLIAVDKLMHSQSAKVLAGLRVQIGEGLAAGGGEAKVAENKVVLNGRGMLMSLAQMREVVDEYQPEELRGGRIPEDEPGGALDYTLGHEIGHIVARHIDANKPSHPGLAVHSPTAYGRVPDEWHQTKDNEAFCDGFSHMAWGMDGVDDTVRAAVEQTVDGRIAELSA
jgi:hypothetical protein